MHTYGVGDRVTHHQYGDGTLTAANEYHTTIDFDAHGARVFSSPRVELTTATTPAPVKPTRKRAAPKKKAVKDAPTEQTT